MRQAYGLSPAEAARALGIPEALYDLWEADPVARLNGPGDVHVENVFTAYSRRHHMVNRGLNLIFATYPLHMARELLCLTLPEMAQAYGATANTWKKYECNHRILPKPILDRIETDVRAQFRSLCQADPEG